MANTTSTGLSISTTSNMSSGQKIMIASAKMAFEPEAPNPDLIRMVRMPEGNKDWTLQTYGRMADASNLAEGVDLTVTQQLFNNTVTITPDEKGIMGHASKRLIRRQGDSDVVGTIGTLLGRSLRRKQDKDVITLYDGVSKSWPGANTAIDITTFRGIVAYLLTDNDTEYGPAPVPFHASLHIEQISDIILDLTDTAPRGTTTGFTDELLQSWWKGSDRLHSVQVFHSGNIARNSNDDAKGCIFARPAFAQVMATKAETTEESDNSLRAFEYGVFQEWSEAELADPYAVEVFSDAASTLA